MKGAQSATNKAALEAPQPSGGSIALAAPPDATWFSLSRRTKGGGWERCERPDWGSASKWWKIEELDPVLVARDGFGPGVYRATWRGDDRRRHRGVSQPFEIVAADSGELPQSVAPTVPDVNVAPVPTALGGLAPLLASDPTGPLAQLMILLTLTREESEQRHQRMMQEHELTLARIHAETEMRVRNLEAHHQLMQGGAVQLAHAIERANDRERTLPVVEQITQLQQAVASLGQRSEQDEDDDDDLDDERMPLARLSDKPTDLERVMTGLQHLVSTIANSPLGKPLGDALARKLNPGSPTLPQRDAAE